MSQSNDPDSGSTGLPAPDPDLGTTSGHPSGDPLLGGGTVGGSTGGITGGISGMADPLADPLGDPLPDPVATSSYAPLETPSDTGAPSKAETAKETASVAKESAANVAGEAKQQAAGLASEAAGHARGVLDSALSTAREQGDQQATRAVGGLRTLSDQARALSEGRTDQAGRLGDLVTQAGDRASSLAGRLESGGIQGVVDDVSGFARRRPGLFLAAAAGLGFLAGRALRANQAAKSDDDEYSAADYPTSGYSGYSGSSYPATSYSTGSLPAADVAAGGIGSLADETRYDTGAR